MHPEYGVKTGDRISFDIYSVISLLGIVQGFFLAVLLFNIKSGNRRANRILAFYLIVVPLNILSDPYFFSGLFYRFPGFSFIGETYPLIILYGPLLYFYTVNLTLPSFTFRPVHMFHLLPAFIAMLVVTHQRLVTGDEELKLFWDSYINDTAYRFSAIDTSLIVIVIIYSGIYLFFVLRLLADHKKRIKKLFSSIEHINLAWLNHIVRFMIVIYIFLAIAYIYWIYGGTYGWFITQRVYPVVITFYIFALGYKGLTQHEIFRGIPVASDSDMDVPDGKRSIPQSKKTEIMEKVTWFMENNKPYLDQQLTLPVLADMLAVPRNYLSQAINDEHGINFFDFINTYRVITAREHLEDPEKFGMNILDIAYESGFNSKATFYLAFKKNTGITPTEYRKKMKME